MRTLAYGLHIPRILLDVNQRPNITVYPLNGVIACPLQSPVTTWHSRAFSQLFYAQIVRKLHQCSDDSYEGDLMDDGQQLGSSEEDGVDVFQGSYYNVKPGLFDSLSLASMCSHIAHSEQPTHELHAFGAPDADIVIVTGGSIPAEIRAHRCVLRAASPFFRDLFSLPQPSKPSTVCGNKDDDIPRIVVPETRQLFITLLHYIYPVRRPTINSLDELSPLLGAALKYDFAVAVDELKKILVSPRFLESSSLRVYGIACTFDLEEEAKTASKYTLGINILDTPLCDEMKYIPAFWYQRLIKLHRTRSKAAQELLKTPRSLKCPQCNGYGHGTYGSPKWWNEFVNRAKAELELRPTSERLFDMEFLSKTCADGCPKCPLSLLEASGMLTDLKRQLDELPSTI